MNNELLEFYKDWGIARVSRKYFGTFSEYLRACKGPFTNSENRQWFISNLCAIAKEDMSKAQEVFSALDSSLRVILWQYAPRGEDASIIMNIAFGLTNTIYLSVADLCDTYVGSSQKVTSCTILDEARAIVDGDREQTYGDPCKTMQMIADLWSVFLRQEIHPEDVAMMMALLKIARYTQSGFEHRGSLVDLCGYAYLIERMQNSHKEDK